MKEYVIAKSWTKNSILVESIPHSAVNCSFEPIFIWKEEKSCFKVTQNKLGTTQKGRSSGWLILMVMSLHQLNTF